MFTIEKKPVLSMEFPNNMTIKKTLFFEILYQNFLLVYFLQLLVQKGKKMFYEKKILQALLLIKLKLKLNPFLIFFEVLEKTKPSLDIKFKKKVHKANKILIPIPICLNQYQQYIKILRWFKLNLIFLMNKNIIIYKFFEKILNLYLYKENFIFQKKNEIYKHVIINKFNKHYRW